MAKARCKTWLMGFGCSSRTIDTPPPSGTVHTAYCDTRRVTRRRSLSRRCALIGCSLLQIQFSPLQQYSYVSAPEAQKIESQSHTLYSHVTYRPVVPIPSNFSTTGESDE